MSFTFYFWKSVVSARYVICLSEKDNDWMVRFDNRVVWEKNQTRKQQKKCCQSKSTENSWHFAFFQKYTCNVCLQQKQLARLKTLKSTKRIQKRLKNTLKNWKTCHQKLCLNSEERFFHCFFFNMSPKTVSE